MYARVTCIPPSITGAQEQPQGHWRAKRYWQRGPQYVELSEEEAKELKRFPQNFIVDALTKEEFEQHATKPPETPEQKSARLEKEMEELKATVAKLSKKATSKEEAKPAPKEESK